MKNTTTAKNLEWSWSPYRMFGLGESDECRCVSHTSSQACGSCDRAPMPRPDPNLIDWVGKGSGAPVKQPLSYRIWLNYYKTIARVKSLLRSAGRDKNPWPR